MKFSVIIPLEFNRGLAVRCIRSWASDQLYARDDYEIVVAASENHPPEEMQAIRELLLPQDRLLQFPFSHDMALVAAAAKEALGDIFVFTESHCLPRKDFLEKSASTMEQHPEWAGFSGMSYPLTHNLLSVIESELYERDIKFNLTRHEWLKVLDQCFIIRRAEYVVTGGIEPAYGHFAEWLFAGRLHSKGFSIGYAPEIEVGHYYIGDLKDLKEFTIDFTRGEMKFAAGSCGDPCFTFFSCPPHWYNRSLWNKSLTGPFFRLLQSLARPEIGEAKETSGLKFRSLKSSLMQSKLRLFIDFWLLRLALGVRLKNQAKTLFQRWICGIVEVERLNFLYQYYNSTKEHSNPAAITKWTPKTAVWWESLGFHEYELFEEIPFRWTQPSGCIRLPLPAGTWEITFQLAPILPNPLSSHLRFFANGLSLEKTTQFPNETLAVIQCFHKGGDLDLTWICHPFEAPGDHRELGLPVSEICWKNQDETPQHSPDSKSSQDPVSTYFLHLYKCAGTSLCSLLENHYPSESCLCPYTDLYYDRELKARKDCLWPAPLIVGHFGWEFPSLFPDRDWQVMTVLRQPAERLLSLYDYLIQHKRISPLKSFDEWLKHDLKPAHFLLPHFVPGQLSGAFHKTVETNPEIGIHLETALSNLRRCKVVGLQENIEDSINLLCHATGCYPPAISPQLNITRKRSQLSGLSSETQSLLNECLYHDKILYVEAEKLFETQRAALQKLALEWENRELSQTELRKVLRKRYFQRHSDQCKPSNFLWRPESIFIGENLHKRECHEGQSLRWTGPLENTVFYFGTGSAGRQASIHLILHSATPRDHAEALQIHINGQKIYLDLKASKECLFLSGKFRSTPNPQECGAYAEIELRSPVLSGSEELRRIGIALQEIRVIFEG